MTYAHNNPRRDAARLEAAKAAAAREGAATRIQQGLARALAGSPDLVAWRERHPDWRCPECGSDRGDGYCQECGSDREDS